MDITNREVRLIDLLMRVKEEYERSSVFYMEDVKYDDLMHWYKVMEDINIELGKVEKS